MDHLDSFGFTNWAHSHALEFIWIHLESLKLTWTHLHSSEFTYVHFNSFELARPRIRMDEPNRFPHWTRLPEPLIYMLYRRDQGPLCEVCVPGKLGLWPLLPVRNCGSNCEAAPAVLTICFNRGGRRQPGRSEFGGLKVTGGGSSSFEEPFLFCCYFEALVKFTQW